MYRYIFPLASCLLLNLHTAPLYAANWGLSLGANDMIVKDARPLSAAPNGDDSHTFGIQVAIYGHNDSDMRIQQKGFFKFFADRDKDKLDPDHIPIWFMAGYQAKTPLFSLSPQTSLNILLDADYKGNSVSSVERQSKLFAGVNTEYNTTVFSADLKLTAGRYALEIDDDVPKTRGYSRDDLKNVEAAFSVAANINFAINKSFTFFMSAQTWQTDNLWLENQYTLQLDHDASNWIKGSTLVVSIMHTEYNLENYNHEDKSAPGYLPILPWNKDTLLQAYLIIPWDL